MTEAAKMCISVPPVVQTFPKTGLEKLRGYLQAVESRTEIAEIRRAADLQLAVTGKTVAASMQMTHLMFQQCAHRLGPGTSRFVLSLAGETSAAEMRELSDANFAVTCWNKLVSLRLPLLQKYRVIRNNHTKHLEGLVGGRQQYLNNHEILERAVAACERLHSGTCEFHGAKLVGRAMTLWFRQTSPLFTLVVGTEEADFYGAYYFTVQETSGTAMRATLAVISPYGVCLAPFRQFGARAPRNQLGDKFNARLERLFSKVFDGKFETDLLRRGAMALTQTSLGFSAGMLGTDREQRVEYLRKVLCGAGLQKDLAAAILEATLYRGRSTEFGPEMQQLSLLFSSRSVLDLFVQLLKQAKSSRPATRERLELLAYRVLTTRLPM